MNRDHEVFEPDPDGTLDLLRDLVADSSAQQPLQLVLEGRQRVVLPEQIRAIVATVVEALTDGRSVTVCTTGGTLSTREAADVLGIGRAQLDRLLRDGRIPVERVAGHRRLQLADVVAYAREAQTDG